MGRRKYSLINEDMAPILDGVDEVPYNKDSGFHDELKECAWNILHENPGCNYDDWVVKLLEQYPTEVVDAMGTSLDKILAGLTKMWNQECYQDPDTGKCHAFSEWAEYFISDRSVELFDEFAEAKRKLRSIFAPQGYR